MYTTKPIKSLMIRTDYINAKQRFSNFGIRKNLCQRLFARNKSNTKNSNKNI